MSVLLMETVKGFMRQTFTPQEVVDVTFYGGQFSADEVVMAGFNSPAILIAGLGWMRPRGGERMAGRNVRVCHMAAFVVTKDADRADRMLSAQRLAERVDLALTTWVPTNAPGAVLEVASPEEDVRCENVYNRKIDAKGLALWLVSWRQCVRATVPLPQLYELLGIDITSTSVMPHQADQAASDEPVPVTHELVFQPPTNN
jgi:hypothetical protein